LERHDQQSRSEWKTRLVEQINSCLRSGDYSRALDLLRSPAAEFPNDAQLSELEQRAQDGVRRNAEANRLITKSRELFAHRKSDEAIQLLREAYDLDKNNSLARAILANALVEHGHSIVETDWLEAETLANQALALNPAHPTAKTIHSLVIEQKKTSSVEDWVLQARKLQSSGDLFAALAWVAEGLAVHPDDPKLHQIHDEIQRDQGIRRRQARRQDLDDLRRMELEIDGAADLACKTRLGERIQAVAARYWTDGEILSVANGLLHRLGLAGGSSTASPHGPGAPVILHVPRPSPPKPPVDTSPISTSPVAGNVATALVAPGGVPPSMAPPDPTTRLEPQLPSPQAATVPVAEPPAPAAEVTSPTSQAKQLTRANSARLVLVSAAAIILVAATFFFARKHHAPPAASSSAAAPPSISAPTASAPAASSPAPSFAVPSQATPESSQADSPVSSGTAAGKVTPDHQPPAESTPKVGALLVAAGQDGARVFLNGKLQPQLTQAGQLRLPNLEPKDYVVQVSKTGFQDPPPQAIRIRKGEQGKLVFDLQPQPRLASLTIQGGDPGTTVLVDQTLVGTVQPDGTLFVSTVSAGNHTVELRKERFKPRQFKERFVGGETISLAAADAVLEAAPGELKITFTPADAKVAISKGELPTMVSSGVSLNLAAGTYALTARTADGFMRFSRLEVIAGQSKTLDLSLAPSGMSKWDDPGAWKQEGDSFTRKGGGFVLYQVVPASGTFAFSAMLTKGHLLQWVLNYTDAKNYVLFQMDDNNFYRTVIRNGEKTDEIKVPDRADKKHLRALHIRVSPTELVHQIRHGDVWTVLDRWTEPRANLSLGKFGFYIPGDDQVALSGFAHYADLNIR
jgi:tetratricopeptide (TPR) repeat protein